MRAWLRSITAAEGRSWTSVSNTRGVPILSIEWSALACWHNSVGVIGRSLTKAWKPWLPFWKIRIFGSSARRLADWVTGVMSELYCLWCGWPGTSARRCDSAS